MLTLSLDQNLLPGLEQFLSQRHGVSRLQDPPPASPSCCVHCICHWDKHWAKTEPSGKGSLSSLALLGGLA